MLARVEFGIIGRTRGAGRAGSAVAAAAYNRCTRFEDGRTAYNFSHKAVEHVGGCLLLPPGAPPELAEPGALWRAAEAAERRADAQLARQLLLTIPREVAAADHLAFACAVVAPYVEEGMGAQIDVHIPRATDGGEQPHAHILLTLRRVSDAGLAATKERSWNVQFRAGGGKAERARVAQRATSWLRAHGIAGIYDLRSLADRGDDRPPEPSAPRGDWQRWRREGMDPDAAPESVSATLAHRGRRSALARAEHAAADAAAEIVALTAPLAVAVDPPKEVESTPDRAQASPPEGAYTPETSGAPTSIPLAQNVRARKAGATAQRPDHYASCRDAWRAELDIRRPDPRAAIRARHRQERDLVYRQTRPGAVRAGALARMERRQAAERVAARTAALAATWAAPAQRETLEAWIARQADAGHPAARALKEARERAAAARARRDAGGEAARRLAEWRVEAHAALAAAPPVLREIRSHADALSARAAAKEEAARAVATAARQAVRNHARRSGWLGGLLVLGRSAVAEHKRLLAAAAAAERRVTFAKVDRNEEERAIRQAAKDVARAASAARRTWATGAGATAGDRLAALEMVQRAVWAGDPDTVAAVLAADERAAGRAAAAWGNEPRRALTPTRAGMTAATTEPRAAALVALARAEAVAGSGSARLAAARRATAAAVAGDPATVAAAAAGDIALAERTAADWQARQRNYAAAREQAMNIKRETLLRERRAELGPTR